jgi:hypothetical protein
VTLRVERSTGKTLRAEGEIADGSGAPVAHRTLGVATGDCGGLARAVGVWASLVLDEEMRRTAIVATAAQPESRADGATGGASAPPGSGAGSAVSRDDLPPDGPGGDATGVDAASGEPKSLWPSPAAPDKPSPEHDWYLHHETDRTLEAGAGVFLMTGTGGGALAGPNVFLVVEAGHGLFLRPSLALGQSLTSLPPSDVSSSMWSAARFDTCLRLPGLYSRQHGMQLDLCGGGDIGFTRVTRVQGQGTSTTTLPYLDIGPSIGIRGELASRLSAELRLVAGVNLVRTSFTDLSGASELPPIAEGRLELAFSWDLR